MKNTKGLLVSLLAAGLIGCSAIVDFSSPSDSGDLYSIEQNMTGVAVVVGTGSVASVEISLDEALPEPEGEDLLEDLLGDVISLTLQNNAGISVSLPASGPVDSMPQGSGEYMISADEARTTLMIDLWNDFEGHTLKSGESYTAIIAVDENDYFESDDFTYPVTAQ